MHRPALRRPGDTQMVAGDPGGKARGLALLAEVGVAVPEWVVLGADLFEKYVQETGLTDLRHLVNSAEDERTAQRYAAELRERVLSSSTPDGIDDTIDAAWSRLGRGPVAVRSSVAAEDGADLSYAGQFETYLNITGTQDISLRVRQCWASAYAPRVLTYRWAHGVREADAIAVVLQRQLDPLTSGVVFTANPTTGARDEMVVSAVYGLGEGLVSGAVDADTVIVGSDGSVRATTIGDKDSRVVTVPGGGIATIGVDDADRRRAALTAGQIQELVANAERIEEAIGAPQDIEWALDGGGLWFLQARPITTVATAAPSSRRASDWLIRGAGECVADDDLRIWDNSNIIESFNGITSPLTYTTAADIYGRVYRGYAESMHLPRAALAQIDTWTPVMLGSFHGRVYYNLLHWYRMVGIAPGHALNRKVLEAALGVAQPLDKDLARTLKPYSVANPIRRLVVRAVTTAVYLRRMRDIDDLVEDFLTEFYRVYDRFENLDVDTMTGEQAYRTYREVEGDLVRRWGPLMVLDAILLTLTGAMYLLTKIFLPRAPEWFLYAVVGPGADVESAEPARAMTALAEVVSADPDVRELVTTTHPASIRRALHEGGHDVIAAAVENYLQRYGYRSLDELKLEVPDLREDPSSLFVMLRSALARGTESAAPPDPATHSDPATRSATAPPESAQQYLDAHLHGLRRRTYDALRGKLSRCAAHRERLRFARTRAFGMVKRLIRVMGRDLAERGVLSDFTEVFELTVTELRECYESGPPDDVTAMVCARRAARHADSTLIAPERFETLGQHLDDAALAAQGWTPVAEIAAAPAGSVLVGTPSCAGTAEATAHVVTEPIGVDGGILVAYRTDPGWVAALPSASALVIERGSPLTHVAIVARELGIPTVVQLRDATALLRSGMHVRVDGTAGTVTVVTDAPQSTDTAPDDPPSSATATPDGARLERTPDHA
ncbi:phosphoenolpyruvate synthase [Gordonia polyisoprenivorans]|uniref:phosphoenolpyruvate synthase n=1 Tax=Gordonia polyisoprenivorans TaxID=84595 RepID=UPI0023016FC6|nr:phosphoenolpyruvate synthase [Gordonia polyisoprenivorans]WCB39902.1 phosphoenolpyruvate synthase [Gordonia polyisoprenivorans]